MSIRSDHETRVTPSILDRLLDYDPGTSRDPARSNSASIGELKQAVQRDLEWLLNTRHTPVDIPESLTEVNNSLAIYGLPDITGLGVESYDEQQRLAKAVETAIRTFEPRFIDLKVTLQPLDSVERSIKFRIEAKLDVDPVPEAVSFDTVLDMGRGEFSVTNG